MRIVSLLPSATELVYALGLGDRLAGVTFECDHPAEATSKPVVSTTSLPTDRPLAPAEIDGLVNEHMDRRAPLYALDRERIAAIQPDLILTQDLCRVCAIPSGQVEDALADLGCSAEVVSMDPRSLEDVLESFLVVGKAAGAEARAEELVGSLRRRVEAVRAAAAGLPRPRTLALEWPDPPFVGGHWIPEMVTLAGGSNVLNDDGERSRTVTWTEIGDADPEVVVSMPCGFGLAEAGRLVPTGELDAAGVSSRIYATDASAYFSRPGPRLIDGLEILAWALHPDVFPEPPVGRVRRVRSVRGVQRRNLVTTEHVGERVTFQYELPNGFLGEVVGTLRWYDDAAHTFVVEDRDGRLVRVPAKGVRYGKPVVPPRRPPQPG